MYKEVTIRKDHDWSLNLEDSYYEEHIDEILLESIKAVSQTMEGRYVNLVTPGMCGEPAQWLIPSLKEQLNMEGIVIKEIRYIDECGCGGHVTRVYK
jgi:putative CGCGG family rSAM target protein